MASLQELMAQREAIDRQIEQTKLLGRGSAISKVRALMSEYGLTLADIGKATASKAEPARPVRKVAAKYTNRATGESWSGRGLQPRWLRSALANGKKISDFAV